MPACAWSADFPLTLCCAVLLAARGSGIAWPRHSSAGALACSSLAGILEWGDRAECQAAHGIQPSPILTPIPRCLQDSARRRHNAAAARLGRSLFTEGARQREAELEREKAATQSAALQEVNHIPRLTRPQSSLAAGGSAAGRGTEGGECSHTLCSAAGGDLERSSPAGLPMRLLGHVHGYPYHTDCNEKAPKMPQQERLLVQHLKRNALLRVIDPHNSQKYSIVMLC